MPTTGSGSASGLATPTPVYTGVYPYLRLRFGDSVRNLTDVQLGAAYDGEIAAEVRKRFKAHGGPAAFTALAGMDRLNADEAIGKWTAISIHVPVTTGGLLAPLVYQNVTSGDNDRITVQTAQVSNTTATLDARVQWEREAWLAWRRCSFVPAPAAPPSLSGMAGRSRARYTAAGRPV